MHQSFWNFYTLAKEKLNMSKFMKTLITSVLAVAVAGTAAADPKMLGVYKGSKTTISINPGGCPSDNEKNLNTVMGFGAMAWDLDDDLNLMEVDMAFAGCWSLSGFSFGQEQELDGAYIERKVGKDLTLALTREDLLGVIEEIDDYLVSESKCDVDLLGTSGANVSSFIVKKGNAKLSKNGDRVKVDIKIDGDYTNESGKTKNVKTKVKGKMDFDPGVLNPAFSCEHIIADCIGDVCAD
jgi:hypothetical protein